MFTSSEVPMLVKASVEPTASVAVQAVSMPADLVVPLVSLEWVVPVASVPRAMPRWLSGAASVELR